MVSVFVFLSSLNTQVFRNCNILAKTIFGLDCYIAIEGKKKRKEKQNKMDKRTKKKRFENCNFQITNKEN